MLIQTGGRKRLLDINKIHDNIAPTCAEALLCTLSLETIIPAHSIVFEMLNH